MASETMFINKMSSTVKNKLQIVNYLRYRQIIETKNLGHKLCTNDDAKFKHIVLSVNDYLSG